MSEKLQMFCEKIIWRAEWIKKVSDEILVN
jgi:hypothetical protein